MADRICSQNGCERKVLGRGLCPSHYSAWHRAQLKYTITCATCGKEAQVARRRTKHCSHQCGIDAVNANIAGISVDEWRSRPKELRRPRRWRRKQAKIDKAARGSRGRTIWVARKCKMCGQSFTVPSSYPDRCCSTTCTKLNKDEVLFRKKARRRARKRNAYIEAVDRLEVFKRDGWRCYICGKKTVDRKQWHKRKATVDHVIPLAKGGTHEMANCRTACWMCNSSKSDGGGGEQLSLAV